MQISLFRTLCTRARKVALLSCAALGLLTAPAAAAPAARLLRIDPRAAQENGNPILTTVIDVSGRPLHRMAGSATMEMTLAPLR